MTARLEQPSDELSVVLRARYYPSKRAYAEYLRTPGWRIRRRAVLRRADGCCELCRDVGVERRATEIHHLTYDRVGCEKLVDLIALCGECHDLAHRGRA